MYRREAAEPYIVPFKSDHPRHVFTNIIDGTLLRAIRYSFTLSAFNEERHSIKLMLLYNGLVFLLSFSLIYSIFTFLIPLFTKINLQSIYDFLQTI